MTFLKSHDFCQPCIILTQALITHQKSIYRKRITAPIYYILGAVMRFYN